MLIREISRTTTSRPFFQAAFPDWLQAWLAGLEIGVLCIPPHSLTCCLCNLHISLPSTLASSFRTIQTLSSVYSTSQVSKDVKVPCWSLPQEVAQGPGESLRLCASLGVGPLDWFTEHPVSGANKQRGQGQTTTEHTHTHTPTPHLLTCLSIAEPFLLHSPSSQIHIPT